MTSTTIIDTRVQRQPRVMMARAGLPRLKTFVGQAIAGAVFSHFIVLVLACLAEPIDLGFWLAALPVFLFMSFLGGVPAGCIIWACTRSDARPLHPVYRCVIAVLVLGPGWFYLRGLTGGGQLWGLGWLLLPAVMIGLLTHSRLRVGHELVRGGEAVRRGSRVLAGFSGVALRVSVVLLFMEGVLTAICLLKMANQQDELLWAVLLCGHFAISLFVVFSRAGIAVLTTLSFIALAPLVIVFVRCPQMTEKLRYVFGGYFALWALFLLTRWRETDDALAFLNEEIHYYLID